MGYIYRARTYVAGPRSPELKRPLAWVIEAYKLPESFYETHCGADATVYVRFLRGCFYWTTCLAWTLFPILMGINYVYAQSSFSPNAIDRASLTALVQGTRGLHLLPIHVVSVWIVVLSWIAMLAWLGHGALRVRRNELRCLMRDDAERRQIPATSVSCDIATSAASPPSTLLDLDPSIPDTEIGWRYRTVLVRNIPPPLRSVESLREFFEHDLRDPESSVSPGDSPPATFVEEKHRYPPATKTSGNSTPSSAAGGISEIVLVRRHTELNQLYFTRYREVLHQLETAHVQLARAVMAWVRERVERDEALRLGRKPRGTKRAWFRQHVRRQDVEHTAREGDALLLERLKPFLNPSRSALPKRDDDTADETLWEALNDLRDKQPDILDRFQPLFRLRYFSAAVPAIDYFLLKHNLLFSLIEDKRAHREAVEASSTAFVTFERASDARRARTQLKWRPIRNLYKGSVFDCKITLAPEVRDLHWPRIALVSLSSDLLRGTLLQALIWAITIIWVLPISVLIGLLSLESLREHVPKLADFLDANPVARSLVTSLLPTAIVALLNMYTPTVIGLIQRHGRTIITESKWSSLTQSSYWKFVVVNLLLIFTIGTTAFTAILNAFSAPISILDVVASAFPKAATFYVSYLLLQVGVQTGVETSLLGISWINHASIRKYLAPRKRALENIPRFFGAQTWLPNHLFVISICLIFAVLNPLVLAFAWLYFGFSTLVLKSQFAHVYYRRNFELGGRVWFRRIFRYSLDICILSSFIMIAFFWVLRQFGCGGACIPLIPIAVGVKILGTRWFDHLMDEIEEARIDAICGEGDPLDELSVPLSDDTAGHNRKLDLSEAFSTIKTFSTVTLPFLALHPKERLPRPPQKSTSFKMAAHRRVQTDRAASSGAARAAQRPRASTVPDDWGRHILAPATSVEEASESPQGSPQVGSTEHPVHDLSGVHAVDYAASQAISAEKAPQPASAAVKRYDKQDVSKSPSSSSSFAPGTLVTTHPPVVRDDRPVSHLRYRNPAETEPLARALWLPRDPLKPVDLGDTIDFHGRALVSSAGGRGIIGQWDESETDLGGDEDEDDEGTGASPKKVVLSPASLFDKGEPSPDELHRAGSRLSGISLGGVGRTFTLKGTERVRVAADVAAKAQLEEPAATNLVRTTTRSGSLGGHSSLRVSLSPHHSPTLSRQPASPRPSSPAISSPAEPHAPVGTPGDDARSSSAYPFPAPVTGPYTTPAGQTHLSPTAGRSLRQRSPSATSLAMSNEGPASPATPTSPTAMRTARSGSVAVSIRSTRTLGHLRLAAHESDILEVAAGEPGGGSRGVVSVSQSAAVRSELLEEERKSHMAHRKQEEYRLAQEKKDREDAKGGTSGGSWFRRLLVMQELAEQADET